NYNVIDSPVYSLKWKNKSRKIFSTYAQNLNSKINILIWQKNYNVIDSPVYSLKWKNKSRKIFSTYAQNLNSKINILIWQKTIVLYIFAYICL
ncbi:MAG: hypothetical protein SWX82_31415, partial [Cyanobacteriota bacterium]|nr:hypothetical protein [Cyanobacteriota bacterium]